MGVGFRGFGSRAYGYGREALVRFRYKRFESRRWRSAVEVFYEEVLRRARRGRRGYAGFYAASSFFVSVYACAVSDFEYSVECEFLFYFIVLDISEDERSNYIINCFGDSEFSVSEGDFVGESISISDSEESGGFMWF